MNAYRVHSQPPRTGIYDPQRPNLRIDADGFRPLTPHHRTVASARPPRGSSKKEKKS